MKRSLMVAAVVALGVAPTAPTTVPVPAPSGSPVAALREIGRVQAVTPLCINTVIHANAAIAAALHDDEAIDGSIAYLKGVDLESNDLKRTKGLAELLKRAVSLRHDSEVGLSEITRLRDLAKGTSDPAVKAELTKFADALGGALYRQKTAAVDMERMVVIVEGRESARDSKREVDQINQDNFVHRGITPPDDAFGGPSKVGGASAGGNPVGTPSPSAIETPSLFRTDYSYSTMAKTAAKAFEQMVPAIMADEGTAAGHTAGAVSGC